MSSTWRWSATGRGCPKRLWNLHPWRWSGLDWTHPSATWSGFEASPSLRPSGLQRSLPTWIIVRLYSESETMQSHDEMLPGGRTFLLHFWKAERGQNCDQILGSPQRFENDGKFKKKWRNKLQTMGATTTEFLPPNTSWLEDSKRTRVKCMEEAYRKPVPPARRALKVNGVSLKLIHCHFIGSEWQKCWVDAMWSQLLRPVSSVRLHPAIAGSSRQPLAGSLTKRKLPLLILMLLLELMGNFTA